jgi:hypothetical protein
LSRRRHFFWNRDHIHVFGKDRMRTILDASRDAAEFAASMTADVAARIL